MSLCKLTVRFEEPFWIGLVECEDGGSYSVAKHVFGAEPTTPEVFDFIRDHWNDLRFTHEVQVEAKESKRINPKRLRRIIEKEIQSDAWRGTKARHGDRIQRGAFSATERRAQARAVRQADGEAQAEASRPLGYIYRTSSCLLCAMGKRVMPSYIMTGGNIQIEKSKVQMITEDIAEMIRIIGA